MAGLQESCRNSQYLPRHLAFHAVGATNNPGARLNYRCDLRGGSSGGVCGVVKHLIRSIVVIIYGDVPVLESVYGSGELALHFGSRDPPAGIWHWGRNDHGYDWLRVTQGGKCCLISAPCFGSDTGDTGPWASRVFSMQMPVLSSCSAGNI